MNIPDINMETVSRVLERNTSKIEKIEAKIKLSRMLSEVTIFPLTILVLSVASYFFYLKLGIQYALWLFISVPMVSGVFFVRKIPIGIKIFLLSITLFISSGVNAIRFTKLQIPYNILTTDSFLPLYTFLCLVVCIISAIIIWYFIVTKIKMIQVKYFKTEILEIKLIGEPPQLYRLINITRRGDYIVNTMKGKNNIEREVLLNRRNILMITYIAEKENER